MDEEIKPKPEGERENPVTQQDAAKAQEVLKSRAEQKKLPLEDFKQAIYNAIVAGGALTWQKFNKEYAKPLKKKGFNITQADYDIAADSLEKEAVVKRNEDNAFSRPDFLSNFNTLEEARNFFNAQDEEEKPKDEEKKKAKKEKPKKTLRAAAKKSSSESKSKKPKKESPAPKEPAEQEEVKPAETAPANEREVPLSDIIARNRERQAEYNSARYDEKLKEAGDTPEARKKFLLEALSSHLEIAEDLNSAYDREEKTAFFSGINVLKSGILEDEYASLYGLKRDLESLGSDGEVTARLAELNKAIKKYEERYGFKVRTQEKEADKKPQEPKPTAEKPEEAVKPKEEEKEPSLSEVLSKVRKLQQSYTSVQFKEKLKEAGDTPEARKKFLLEAATVHESISRRLSRAYDREEKEKAVGGMNMLKEGVLLDEFISLQSLKKELLALPQDEEVKRELGVLDAVLEKYVTRYGFTLEVESPAQAARPESQPQTPEDVNKAFKKSLDLKRKAIKRFTNIIVHRIFPSIKNEAENGVHVNDSRASDLQERISAILLTSDEMREMGFKFSPETEAAIKRLDELVEQDSDSIFIPEISEVAEKINTNIGKDFRTFFNIAEPLEGEAEAGGATSANLKGDIESKLAAKPVEVTPQMLKRIERLGQRAADFREAIMAILSADSDKRSSKDLYENLINLLIQADIMKDSGLIPSEETKKFKNKLEEIAEGEDPTISQQTIRDLKKYLQQFLDSLQSDYEALAVQVRPEKTVEAGKVSTEEVSPEPLPASEAEALLRDDFYRFFTAFDAKRHSTSEVDLTTPEGQKRYEQATEAFSTLQNAIKRVKEFTKEKLLRDVGNELDAGGVLAVNQILEQMAVEDPRKLNALIEKIDLVSYNRGEKAAGVIEELARAENVTREDLSSSQLQEIMAKLEKEKLDLMQTFEKLNLGMQEAKAKIPYLQEGKQINDTVFGWIKSGLGRFGGRDAMIAGVLEKRYGVSLADAEEKLRQTELDMKVYQAQLKEVLGSIKEVMLQYHRLRTRLINVSAAEQVKEKLEPFFERTKNAITLNSEVFKTAASLAAQKARADILGLLAKGGKDAILKAETQIGVLEKTQKGTDYLKVPELGQEYSGSEFEPGSKNILQELYKELTQATEKSVDEAVKNFLPTSERLKGLEAALKPFMKSDQGRGVVLSALEETIKNKNTEGDKRASLALQALLLRLKS